MSPLGARLLGLLISSITIKIAAYLFSMELKVDLSRSNVDDRACGVEERPSKDDGCVIFLFSHVQNHEVGRSILIMYSYYDIFGYSF